MHACVRARARPYARVRACVKACVRACMRVRVRVRVCVGARREVCRAVVVAHIAEWLQRAGRVVRVRLPAFLVRFLVRVLVRHSLKHYTLRRARIAADTCVVSVGLPADAVIFDAVLVEANGEPRFGSLEVFIRREGCE